MLLLSVMLVGILRMILDVMRGVMPESRIEFR